MQRIALIRTIGASLAIAIPIFIAREFYFLSLACLLGSTYCVVRGGQIEDKYCAKMSENVNQM